MAESERQPERSLSQQERFEARPEPELDRERLERDLPVRGRPKLVSFFPAGYGGVFSVQLAAPAAEHFPNLVEFFRKEDKLFIIKSFYFPGDLQKKFKQIKFRDGPLNIRQFLAFVEIACNKSKFGCLYKQRVNFLTQSVARGFGKMRQKFMP